MTLHADKKDRGAGGKQSVDRYHLPEGRRMRE